jgi:hypothetical protein
VWVTPTTVKSASPPTITNSQTASITFNAAIVGAGSVGKPAVCPGRRPGNDRQTEGGAAMAKDHGSSVMDDKQYEGLRKKGMSKERAAKIANTKGASKKGGKKSKGGSGGGTKSGQRKGGRKGGKKSS